LREVHLRMFNGRVLQQNRPIFGGTVNKQNNSLKAESTRATSRRVGVPSWAFLNYPSLGTKILGPLQGYAPIVVRCVM